MNLKRGDEVVYLGPKQKRACRVIALYNEMNPPAVRVAFGETELICRQPEVVPVAEHQAAKEALAREEATKNCQPLVDAWNAGSRSIPALSAALCVPPVGVLSKYRQAKRWGLLT